MPPSGKSVQPRKGQGIPSLKEQAHKEIMDLLHVAEDSSYPAIRAAAIQMAKEKSRYEQKQEARLSPTLVLWVNIVLGVATILACWYAFLYQRGIAYQLSGLSILLFVVVAAITLFLSGLLSQANLMKVFGWAMSHVKGWLKPLAHPESDSVSPKK